VLLITLSCLVKRTSNIKIMLVEIVLNHMRQ